MKYISQSLTTGEEVVRMGHFHWMYTVNAVFWIVLGFALAIVILWGGIELSLMNEISSNFKNLPEQFVPQAKKEIMQAKGGAFGMIAQMHPGIKVAAFGMVIFGLFSFARMMVIKATTEICITNSRLVCKQGLIARSINEMSVDRIEGVNVFQGVLGRLFGYGYVVVRGMGVGELNLPPIAEPIAFRKAIERSKTL